MDQTWPSTPVVSLMGTHLGIYHQMMICWAEMATKLSSVWVAHKIRSTISFYPLATTIFAEQDGTALLNYWKKGRGVILLFRLNHKWFSTTIANIVSFDIPLLCEKWLLHRYWCCFCFVPTFAPPTEYKILWARWVQDIQKLVSTRGHHC